MGVRAVREVARRPSLDRHRKDVAPRDDQRPLALRTELEVFNQIRGRHPCRPLRHAIVWDPDRQLPRRCLVDREDLEFAVQLIDNLVPPIIARPANVPRPAPRELARGARLDVIAEQVHVAVPIRGKVDVVADPHRVAIRPRVIGDAIHVMGRQVEEVQIVRPSTFVPLLGAKIAEHRRIHDAPAVGREIAGA